MPLQNRVSPDGGIVAVAHRGTMMGNRGGCFHTADQILKHRPFASRQWICCVLDFKGRRRTVMTPGRYTELFFLDEATALAAGHRPCFECRHADARLFAEIWRTRAAMPRRPSAPEMDAVLHGERIDADSFTKVTYSAHVCDLPDYTFVRYRGEPHIVRSGGLRKWRPAGYDRSSLPYPDEPVSVLTPATIVAQLANGYVPKLHSSLSVPSQPAKAR